MTRTAPQFSGPHRLEDTLQHVLRTDYTMQQPYHISGSSLDQSRRVEKNGPYTQYSLHSKVLTFFTWHLPGTPSWWSGGYSQQKYNTSSRLPLSFRHQQGAKKRVKKSLTCGSTVFSPGHPRQYSLAPAMLNFADRTRRGVFIAVWPQMRFNYSKHHYVPF